MAAYAEARVDRLLRGAFKMDHRAGGNAIAVALLNKRYTFARKLIADGYHLADASDELARRVLNQASAHGKKLAEDHLSGRMQAVDVEKISPPRPQHGAATYMPMPGMMGALRHDVSSFP